MHREYITDVPGLIDDPTAAIRLSRTPTSQLIAWYVSLLAGTCLDGTGEPLDVTTTNKLRVNIADEINLRIPPRR